VDMTTKLPRDAQWEDLQRHAQVFAWQDGRFASEQPLFAHLPLTFDSPPDSQTSTQIVKAVGHRAQDTRRVQVPFAAVAPQDDAIWTGDCSNELTVPLGRSGATQTLSLRLGQGTAQHVLIAGKTGSGKSTLLHALITNAALTYSPDEVQFFLIDFKKGVEFKAYADYLLPHARVIAIESEREFGLSVLHRLDHELQRRGDLFRDAGVQMLAAYRARHPQQPLPRLLLIVDEFQEFFVNDDKLAHEASLLLDRLVRQGRAFGIHVILGSQTLAGAYSLARSTIGQMAVRIALECSAADAHLILSEDNTAARLLGRPGEAIYNDANGRLEGNHPFQVVWLPDQQRNDFLDQIRQWARDAHYSGPPPIIFEGHAAADLGSNTDLRRLVEMGSSAQAMQPPRAWLGAAIEIKAPTSVGVRRQGGANLLVVGQSRELARGLLGSCLLSLAATHVRASQDQPARRAEFWILDGQRAEQPQTDFADALQPYLAAPWNVAGPAQAARWVDQVAAQLERRLETPEGAHESVYLVIHDLARFRDLQPAADDFGLGSFGSSDSKTPSAQLAKILREGPALGIHALIWADCHHTVSRWFDRPTLRDFGQRVLLQMSALDSSHLMDSAAASQLGAHRALLYDQDRGQSEKFRPYAFPPAAWLRDFQHRLQQPPLRPVSPDQGSAPSDAETLV
jgi:DNA segregation ATPase FtsK/SpoIIIE, S-DNA-T family